MPDNNSFTEQSIEKSSAAILEIEIDGEWLVNDLIHFLQSFEGLYKIINVAQALEKHEFANLPGPQLYYKFHLLSVYLDGEKYKLLDWKRGARLEPQSFGRNEFEIAKGSNTIFDSRPLELLSMRYGSPGCIDLIGLGKVFKTLSTLLTRYLPNRKERIENADAEEDLLRKRIENLKSVGFSNSDIQYLLYEKELHLKTLRQLTEENKILGLRQKKEN